MSHGETAVNICFGKIDGDLVHAPLRDPLHLVKCRNPIGFDNGSRTYILTNDDVTCLLCLGE